MKLSELQPKQSGVNVTVEVVDLGEVREFNKFGKVGRVCNATIKDDSAQMKLTLWNDDIDRIKVGAKLNLVDCFVNEWQGDMQLTTGRNGKIEVMEAQASLATAEEEKPEEKAAEPKAAIPVNEEPIAKPDVKSEEADVEEEFIE